LTKIEGVDKVMLSGMTAFVTTKSADVKLTRGTLRKAFDSAGIKVERVKPREIQAPKEAYQLAVTGGT
jgi:hypothetical protein